MTLLSVQSTSQLLLIHILSSTLTPHFLQIDFTACFCCMTCIHCEVVNLPNLKEEQGIPDPYSLFNNPYNLQPQGSFWERDIVLQIIYFDKLEGSQLKSV